MSEAVASESFLSKMGKVYLIWIKDVIGIHACNEIMEGSGSQKYYCMFLAALPLLIVIAFVYFAVKASCLDQIRGALKSSLSIEGYGPSKINLSSAAYERKRMSGCDGIYGQISPDRCSIEDRSIKNIVVNELRDKAFRAGLIKSSKVAPETVKGDPRLERDLRHNTLTLSPSDYRVSGKKASVPSGWIYAHQNDKDLKCNRNPLGEPPIYNLGSYGNDAATRAGLPSGMGKGACSEGFREKAYIRKEQERLEIHNPTVVTDHFQNIYESMKSHPKDFQDRWKIPREPFNKLGPGAAGRCSGRRYGGRSDNSGGCKHLYRALSSPRSYKLDLSQKPAFFSDPRISGMPIPDLSLRNGKVVGMVNQ